MHLSTVLCLSSGTLANLTTLHNEQSPCLDHSNPRLSSDYCVFNKVAEPSSRRLYGHQSPFKHRSMSFITLTPECQELATGAGQYSLPASLLSIQPLTQARCCPPELLLSILPDSTCPKHEASTVYSPRPLIGMITECKQLLSCSANTESGLPPITAFSHLNGSLLRREQHIAGQPAKMSFRLQLLPIHVFFSLGSLIISGTRYVVELYSSVLLIRVDDEH